MFTSGVTNMVDLNIYSYTGSMYLRIGILL